MGDENDAVADEGDWYAALVAGEHVGDWLDTVRNAKIPPGRRTRAARQLAEKVAADRTYADEAREGDAADVCEAAARDVPEGDDDERLVAMREAFRFSQHELLRLADFFLAKAVDSTAGEGTADEVDVEPSAQKPDPAGKCCESQMDMFGATADSMKATIGAFKSVVAYHDLCGHDEIPDTMDGQNSLLIF